MNRPDLPPRDKDVLGTFFAEFLDEAAFAEFREVERMFGALTSQGSTRSGYPVIRPADCARITRSLDAMFDANEGRFRTADPAVTERFEALIGAFHEFTRSIYPGEATGALVLHARVLLFMGEPARAIPLLEHLALRPYAVADNLDQCFKLVELFARAHLMQGTLDRLPLSFIAFGAWVASSPRAPSLFKVARAMAPFVAAETRPAGARARWVQQFSRLYLNVARGRTGLLKVVISYLRSAAILALAAMGYAMLRTDPRRRAPFGLHMDRAGPVLVTRAMGGIGDLLMMEPGLEALSARFRQPVHFAIPRKFWPIFEANPHVELIDIDGPPIDVGAYRLFTNLSLCPAGRYESKHRPNVPRGRVEIFARAMGVGPAMLREQGWHINRYLTAEREAECDRLLAERGVGQGQRPLVGVQPFSRDAYKDHPHIGAIMAGLAKHNDLLVFHHVADGLPQGPGIASTAGLGLAQSLALVSRLDAMVCVDSAFLHAAAAHDVPVVALFGPTDARTFTRHHKRVEIAWRKDAFPCVPCWRNEDLPCALTRQTGTSPCMAAIGLPQVEQAVARALEPMAVGAR